MKKIIFILFIVFNISLYSQNTNPKQHKFYIYPNFSSTTKDSVYISADSSRFKMNDEFRFNWHWSTTPINSQKMGFNTGHSKSYYGLMSPNRFKDSVRIIMLDELISTQANFYNQSLTLKPTLLIDTSLTNSTVQSREKQGRKYIYGFGQIKGETITNDTSNANYDYLILKDTASYISSTVPILSRAWNFKNNLTSDTNIKNSNINGLNWRLGITLKRNNLSDIALSPDTVLTIKMPTDSVPIVFSWIPRPSNYQNVDVINDNIYRGRFLSKTTNIIDKPTVFTITKDMIPIGDTAITIYANFITDKSDNNNDLIQNLQNLSVNVYYRGKCDVAISEVFVRTPQAFDFFFGSKDTAIVNGYQRTFNYFENPDSAYWSHKKVISRFYFLDEVGDNMLESYKYLNELVGNIFTTEKGFLYPHLADYYVNMPEKWLGHFKITDYAQRPYNKWVDAYSSIFPGKSSTNDLIANGFKFSGGTDNKGYNYRFGAAIADTIGYQKNSFYETGTVIDYAHSPYKQIPFNQTFAAPNNLDVSFTQHAFESLIIDNYVNKPVSNYLYSNKAWWCQTFFDMLYTGTHIYKDTFNIAGYAPSDTNKLDTALYHKGGDIISNRLTGEEMSFFTWYPLIMGAKGFSYDSDWSSYYPTSVLSSGFTNTSRLFCPDDSKLSYYATLTPDQYIDNDSLGSDFIGKNATENSHLKNYLNWRVLPRMLGIEPDRYYLGSRSVRRTIKNMQSFINSNGNAIINFELQSYLGKGYTKQYHQHPSHSGDFMSKYVKTDLKYWGTRPIGRTKTVSGNTVPYFENQGIDENSLPIDSSFFDATIMFDKTDTNNGQKSWILGLCNRRTDPLTYWTDTYYKRDYDDTVRTAINDFRFISSSEFLDSCQRGGANATRDSIYKSYYWKKQGCREITIPFNFTPTNNYDYCLLHVKEMYDTSAYAVNLRNVTKTKLIDTVIGQDSPLALNFQPGEGKFLKVEVIYPQTNLIGKLDHSNQNKFCEYTNPTTKKTTFYATYFSGDSVPINFLKKFVNRVYIVQSYPTFRDSGNNIGAPNVRWYNPLLLSNFITDGANTRVNYNCTHPSLVIGRDTLGNRRAYVAYQCNDTVPTVPTKLMIVESVVKLFDDMSPMSILSSTRIGDAYYDTLYGLKEYGNPVINYSEQGNFYAWSTAFVPTLSTDGIIFGFKKRGETYLQSTGKITPQMLNAPPMSRSYFRHPGMNPYSVVQASDTSGNETEAMLAFQMANTSNSSWGVANDFLYYTKLILDASGKVTHTLGNYSNGKGLGWEKIPSAMEFINNDSIIKFKWAARMANKPVCFSVPDSIIDNSFKYKAIYFERRYWPGISQLVGFNILERPRKKGFSWYIQSVARISPIDTSIQDLGYPHLGNAEEIKFNTSGVQVRNGLGLLNFTWGDKIYHYPVSDKCKISNDGFSSEEELASKLSYVSDGKLPHLVNSPFKHSFNDIWRNRRIFNTFGTNEKIVPSSRYFYKKNSNGDEVTALYGFDADTISCKLGKSYFDGNELQLKLPYSLVDSSYIQNNSDTIYSNWFTVNTASQLSFVYRARHFSSHYLSYIERRDSLSHINIPLSDISDSCISLVNVNLTNGGGHEYRYVLQRLDTISRYTEEMLLGNIKFKDTLFYKSQGRHSGFNIDLGGGIASNLRVIPNPATDQILVNIGILDNENMESKFRLLISNNAGQVLFEKDVSQQTTENIGISDFTNGSYNVSIYSKSWNGSKLPLARTMFAKVK